MQRFEHRCHFCNQIIDKAYQPYCNSKCELAAENRDFNKLHHTDVYTKVCKHCRILFITSKSNKEYHSKHCQISHKYTKKYNGGENLHRKMQRHKQVSSANPPLPLQTEMYITKPKLKKEKGGE